MFKRILVPTDGSDLARKGADAAIRLAAEAKASIVALTVLPSYHPSPGAEMPVFALSRENYESGAKEAAAKILEPVAKAAADAGVACETVTALHDHPWEVILSTASEKGCDLVYMSSHGRSGIGALVLGSETRKVLTHGKVPVLVHRG